MQRGIMGFMKKVAVLSTVVVLSALVWQWSCSINVEEFYTGKRVIVTGASRGIGKSLAIQLAQLGAKLVIAARTADVLEETRQECLKYTSDVHTVVADVSNEENCQAIVNKTVTEFGGVDILILNAAYSPKPQYFTDAKEPQGRSFANVFGVNLLQSVHLVHFSLPYLNASRGIIVPVSSGSGIVAIPKVLSYATSKHALHGFFKSLNQEFVLTGTPISITIMPLPYVLTKKAVDNWKPIGTGDGITPEDCADRMLRGIPQRRLWYYIDWSMYFVGHLYSLYPELFDTFVRIYLPQMSRLF